MAQEMREGSSTSNAPARKQFAFEVFSIRPHKAGTRRFSVRLTPDGYRATINLEFAIQEAYFAPKDGLTWSSWKIENAPAWVTSDWYDVEARVAPEDATTWKKDVEAWQ